MVVPSPYHSYSGVTGEIVDTLKFKSEFKPSGPICTNFFHHWVRSYVINW